MGIAYALGFEDGWRGLARLGCSLAYVSGYRQGMLERLARTSTRPPPTAAA